MAVMSVTLAALVSLNEAVSASLPSLVRSNLEQRAEALAPVLAGSAPDRYAAAHWLRQQGDGISSVELSRTPRVSVSVSSSVGLMAIVDGEARVVAARGEKLPAGAPLGRFLSRDADAVVRAALAGRRDASSLTARLGDGSLAGAAPVSDPDGRVLGALVVTFTELDQPNLLVSALVMTFIVFLVLGPLAAMIGAATGLLIGRRSTGPSEPAPFMEEPGLQLTSSRLSGLGRFAALTARELEVLRRLADADTNAAIAARLHISEKTVKKHVSNILGKLEVPDRTKAAVLAWQQGLVGKEP
jgi:DNA-binding CsgD family transcriptional regulator